MIRRTSKSSAADNKYQIVLLSSRAIESLFVLRAFMGAPAKSRSAVRPTLSTLRRVPGKFRRLLRFSGLSSHLLSAYLESVNSFIALRQPGAERISRRCYNLIRALGNPPGGYKVCIITESMCLERAAQSAGGDAGEYLHTPFLDQLLCYLKANASDSVTRLKSKLSGISPRHIARLLLRKVRGTLPVTDSNTIAGVFQGMGYHYVSPSTTYDKKDKSTISDHECSASNYQQVTRQALDYLETLRSIRANASKDSTISSGKNGRIGVLISLFHPEDHIDSFIDNLLQLNNLGSLVPILINAGMSSRCWSHINEVIASTGFHQVYTINAPNSGIYEAWNMGVEAALESVDYFTNFNVDDLRHPLCLEVQRQMLETFPSKQLSVTDYIYYFGEDLDLHTIYKNNLDKRTWIPVINRRTIVYRNLPHSSPMWRASLHKHPNSLRFDTRYTSAGDADYWYRVMRSYENPAVLASIPLSLYYYNPTGLSTRGNTKGVTEHRLCTDPHYNCLIDEIDQALTPQAIRAICKSPSAEYMQLYVASSILEAVK